MGRVKISPTTDTWREVCDAWLGKTVTGHGVPSVMVTRPAAKSRGIADYSGHWGEGRDARRKRFIQSLIVLRRAVAYETMPERYPYVPT